MSTTEDLSTNEYGIKLVGGTAAHPELYIKFIDPEKKGYDLLKVKDRVIGLNGISMAGHTWDEAMYRIKGSDEKLTVTVQRHITLRPYEVSRLFKQKEVQKAEYAKRKADEKEAKRRAKSEKQQENVNLAQGDHSGLNGHASQHLNNGHMQIVAPIEVQRSKSSNISSKYGAQGSLKVSKNSSVKQKSNAAVTSPEPEPINYQESNQTTEYTTEETSESVPNNYQPLADIQQVNSLEPTNSPDPPSDNRGSASPDQKSSNVSRSKSLGIKSDVPKAKLKLTHNNSISTTNNPTNNRYKFFGGTGEKCTKCEKTVYHAERCIGPQGDIYHRLCLSCAICRANLATGNWCDHDRVPYCKSCHMKQFGPTGTLGRF